MAVMKLQTELVQARAELRVVEEKAQLHVVTAPELSKLAEGADPSELAR